jgi:threonyl-tRNA synthetase
MLVVGGREEEEGAVSVRLRTEEDLGAMPVDELVARVAEKTASRSHEL